MDGAAILAVGTNSAGYASMTGPVPRSTPRSAPGRAEASHSEVLASVERQIRSKRAQQAHDTRPAEDTCAKEVLQRFRVALTTCLESDAELLSAEDADVPLRWRRLLEFLRPPRDADSCHCAGYVRWCNRQPPCTAGIDRVAVLDVRQVVAPTVSRGC